LEVSKDSLRAGAVMLTTESAICAITATLLGADGVSLEALLAATADPVFASRVEAIPPDTVTSLCRTLGELLGPAGTLVAGTLATRRGERSLPAGLAAGTVAGEVSGSGAQARMEMLTGVDGITDEALDAWASAAEQVFRELTAEPGREAIAHS